MQKQIKTKNYFILLGIILITCIICLYLFSWLKQYNEIKLGTPIISNTLQEVKYDNLDDFLRERDFAILYMCTTSEKNCRSFENKLVKYVKEYNLTDNIVYFNLGERTVNNNILNRVYNKYKHNDLIKKLNNYPSFVIFSDGKIIDLLSPNKGEELTIKMLDQFLEGYSIEND